MWGAYHHTPPTPDSALLGAPTCLRTAALLWSQAVTPRTTLTGPLCYRLPSAWPIPTATATGSPPSRMGGPERPGRFPQPRPNANNRTAASMDTLRRTTSAPAVTGTNCGGGNGTLVGSCWCTGSEWGPWRARGLNKEGPAQLTGSSRPGPHVDGANEVTCVGAWLETEGCVHRRAARQAGGRARAGQGWMAPQGWTRPLQILT